MNGPGQPEFRTRRAKKFMKPAFALPFKVLSADAGRFSIAGRLRAAPRGLERLLLYYNDRAESIEQDSPGKGNDMVILLLVLSLAIFLIGLAQWARSGAALWSVLRARKSEAPEDGPEQARQNTELRRMERMTDRLLLSSFKVIGVLAVAMWLFLGLTVLLDLMGINWADRISLTARRFWGSPVYNHAPARPNTPSGRNDILRSLGDKLRK